MQVGCLKEDSFIDLSGEHFPKYRKTKAEKSKPGEKTHICYCMNHMFVEEIHSTETW